VTGLRWRGPTRTWDLLIAAARGDIVIMPASLRRLIRVPEEFAHIVRLPVTALLKTLRLRSPAP
jgi:hypothetical protein